MSEPTHENPAANQDERSDRPERDRYTPKDIEPKWQKYWDEHKTFAAVRHAGRPKQYILDMFPYPSGNGLHVGHPEGYTATDIIARYQRMRGVDVLHPMGWDAFGLPAEQHAIKTKEHPGSFTTTNIGTFRRQLKMLGFSYDWDREVNTTDPNYVRWTQWIFLQLYKKGMAFQQSDMPVNWCPELGTVLANDEVVDGRSEVGGFPVEKRRIRQWSLRITAYADRLLEGLQKLDWPDTKGKQTHWIGRSEGANIVFTTASGEKINAFTTRADTLAGATYVVLAPEHALALTLATPEHASAVKSYVEAAAKKTDIDRSDATREKTGVPTGATCVNPLTGESIPVWVGDYVIGSYGTGAVMAVPAHDDRDHAFALKFKLPIIEVIASADGKDHHDVQASAMVEDGRVTEAAVKRCVSGASLKPGLVSPSAPLRSGMSSEDARKAVTNWLAEKGAGEFRVTYRLRDWVFSRQRYWGEPIPIYFPVTMESGADPRADGAKYTVHYDQPIAVEESELPLSLPDLEDFKPTGDFEGPLGRAKDWRFFQKNGSWFARETNTMPQWAGSCWYYLRYLDPKSITEAWTQESYDAWMPVDLYVGGSEHAVLHLLYARFWHKVLFDLGLVKHDEPFLKLVHQGMILGEDNQKMSKSRGNVINPDHMVNGHVDDATGKVTPAYGADALRTFEMFMGPLEHVKPWKTSGIEGVKRFLDRLYIACTENIVDAAPDDETNRLLHKTVAKVTGDIDTMHFNTAVSQMMIFVKHLGQKSTTTGVPRSVAKTLTLLVSPFAPHLGEELWQRLGGDKTLAYEPWPTFDPKLVVDDTVEIGVQVNGKLRGVMRIAVDADEAAAKALALSDDKVRESVEGKTVRKIVYVPGKILNFIVG